MKRTKRAKRRESCAGDTRHVPDNFVEMATRATEMLAIGREARKIIARSKQEAELILNDPIYQLSYPRTWGSLFAENAGNHDETWVDRLVFSHIMGMDRVPFRSIPTDVLAKIVMVILYRTRVALSSGELKYPTLDCCLNNEHSKLVIPIPLLMFDFDIEQHCQVYLKCDLRYYLQKVPSDTRKGHYLLLTDSGSLEWTYESRQVSGVSRLYAKKLKSKLRMVARTCHVEKLDLAGFRNLFSGKPELAMHVIHSVKSMLKEEKARVSRTKFQLENIESIFGGALSRIA